MNLSNELAVAQQLAHQAGALVLEYRKRGLDVERKAGNEPVTQADRAASELIVQGLQKLFPGDIIVSEESDDDLRRLNAARVWYVDPIDGTNDFINDREGFSVMIGLAFNHKPILGVVYQPIGSHLFYATTGNGAWLRDATQPAVRLRCSETEDLTELRLVASRSHRSQSIDRVKSALGVHSEFNIGSVGLKLGLIARAQRDVYVNPASKCKSWDTCAPEIILTEANGKLTDLYGTPLRYDERDLHRRTGLVASNGILHHQIIEKLKPLFPRR